MDKNELRKLITEQQKVFIQKGRKVKILQPEKNKTVTVKSKAPTPRLDPDNGNQRASGWMRKPERTI